MNQEIATKSALFGLSSFLIDKYVFAQQNTTNSVFLGLSGAAGVYLADSIASNIPENFKMTNLDGKLLETRLLEIGGLSATSIFLDKYFIGDRINDKNLMQLAVTYASADVISTYATDYLLEKPLSFFG